MADSQATDPWAYLIQQCEALIDMEDEFRKACQQIADNELEARRIANEGRRTTVRNKRKEGKPK
jgi:hypothetical protein